jgi:hypothetical protein
MGHAACLSFKRTHIRRSAEARRSSDQSHVLRAAWAPRPLGRRVASPFGIHDEAWFSAITNAASNGSQSTKSVLDETASVRRLSAQIQAVTFEDVAAELIFDNVRAAPIGRCRGAKMDRLRTCIVALRVLVRSNDPNRAVLVDSIDEYLKTETVSLTRALERLRRAIHYEEGEGRWGENWSIPKEYVRPLLHRMSR